ncbi:TPA: type IV secretion protein Rhs, partial [Candidatus Falkowbacteria bacterium]|nr:type IV secretion protein Rhs [Candidatus Falkowbacteria bacterium]
DYKPFGEARVNVQNTDYDETKKFTGYESDPSGLSYAGARY